MKNKIATLIFSGFISNSFILQAQAAAAAGGQGGMMSMLLPMLLILLIFLLPVIDILKSRFESDTNKLIWLVLVIFVPILGLILYLLIGRKQKVNYK